MKNSLAVLLIIIGFICVEKNASGDVVPISGYDINDAVISGHGGTWAHTYSGTITPGVAFVNFGFAGTTASYSGVGSGTLNDGVFGTSTGNSQLFVTPSATDGTLINPAIFLTFSQAYFIDDISLFGGDIVGNGIPGAITGVTVSLLDTNFNLHTETFLTSSFGPDNGAGPVNDFIDLTGSSLDGIGAFALFLSDFNGTNANWFSITEIVLNGSAVPEPGSFALFALASMGCVCFQRKRRQPS